MPDVTRDGGEVEFIKSGSIDIPALLISRLRSPVYGFFHSKFAFNQYNSLVGITVQQRVV